MLDKFRILVARVAEIMDHYLRKSVQSIGNTNKVPEMLENTIE